MTAATSPGAPQGAFVLHAYPYRETSLIVEFLTERDGRLAAVARGAKRARSELRGTLQSFQPLRIATLGTRELKTLTHAEWEGGMPLPAGAALLCAFYLNELVLKLVAREDPHPGLYRDYAAALTGLAHGAEQAPLLRAFELSLLAAMGYGLNLTHEADTGAAVIAGERYLFSADRGARRVASRAGAGASTLVQGATLLALSSGVYDATAAAEAKRLMRVVLDHHLESRTLASRRIVRDLAAFDEADGT